MIKGVKFKRSMEKECTIKAEEYRKDHWNLTHKV